MPELIQRLVFAQCTRNSLKRGRFPNGDRISENGFDGYVRFLGDSSWVPTGNSVWEMGTNANVKLKADKDWAAGQMRSWPSNDQKKDFTWAFISPHPWGEQDREAWVDSKKSLGIWKDVRVYDVTDIETWLVQCPLVAYWFKEIIGCAANDIYNAEFQVRNFLPQHENIKAKIKLLVGGRDDEYSEVEKFLLSTRKRLKVNGESRNEASLFIAAVALSLENNHNRISILSRLVFVLGQNAIDNINESYGEVIIVPLTKEAENVALSSSNPNLRVVCLGIKKDISLLSTGYENVDLSRLRSSPVEDALISFNIQEQLARTLSREAKGSLYFLEWSLDENSSQKPAWCNHDLLIFACLWLVGQWNENNENDRKVVEELSEKSWNEVKKIILPELQPGGQFEKFGTMTDWKAWPSCLNYVLGALDCDLLQRYKKLILEVFSIHDPTVEMNSTERMLADWDDIRHPYSPYLRSGILSSLTMLGVHCKRQEPFINTIVKELLSGEGKELGLKLATLASNLGDLAEAAPEIFLDVCVSLSLDREACECLFVEDKDFFSPRSFHCNVLWAIERLAWSPDYFAATVDILARFEELKLKTFVSNTPLNSLVDIFLPWYKSTLAEYDLRVTTFKLLADNHWEVAWDLACKIMPSRTSNTSGTDKPKWQNWLPLNFVYGRTINERILFSNFIVDWMIDQAVDRPEYWCELIRDIHRWKRETHVNTYDKFIKCMSQVNISELEKNLHNKIYDELFRFIKNQQEYSDKNWAMLSCELEPLIKVLDFFEPKDPISKHIWLFNEWPRYVGRKGMTHAEQESYLEQERNKAIVEIYNKQGLKSIIKAALDNPNKAWRLGYSLAIINLSHDDETFLYKFGLDNPINNNDQYSIKINFLNGYISREKSRYSNEQEWLDKVLSRGISWNELKYINLSLLLAPNSKNWNTIASFGKSVDIQYWKLMNKINLSNFQLDLTCAVKKLLSASRPCFALDMIIMAIHKNKKSIGIKKSLIEYVIYKSAMQGGDVDQVDRQMIPYNVDQALQYLENQGVRHEHIAPLEWRWLKVLDRQDRGIKSLNHMLSTSPQFFIDTLCLCFKAEGDNTQKDISEIERLNIERGFYFLQQWEQVPGAKYEGEISGYSDKYVNNSDNIYFRNGNIDERELYEYVNQARSLALKVKRLKICDDYLGKVIASSPMDKNGIWPCGEICRLVEVISSDELDNGISVGIFNNRGAHIVIPGGKGDLKIASQFKQYLGYRRQYPRVVKILSRIINSFEYDAKSHQERERFRDYI